MGVFPDSSDLYSSYSTHIALSFPASFHKLLTFCFISFIRQSLTNVLCQTRASKVLPNRRSTCYCGDEIFAAIYSSSPQLVFISDLLPECNIVLWAELSGRVC